MFKSVFIILVGIGLIIGGLHSIYLRYKNQINDENSTMPNLIFYIRGFGAIIIGLMLLIGYLKSLI